MNQLEPPSIPLRLLQEFADDQDIRRCSVTCNVVLCSGRSSDQRGCGVLDLHLMQKHIAVFCDLDITGTRDQPERDTAIPLGVCRRCRSLMYV